MLKALMARPLQSSDQVQRRQVTMDTRCEVIGWLLDEEDRAQVLIREHNGDISLQTADLESTFGQYAIQTGAFRRGNPIVDPITRETLGYEMERVANPLMPQL
ncbi:MAG TPA: hypothetical protein VIT67_13180 [Povalibacter sp.]